MTTTKQQLLTADDLLRLYSQGVRGELIRGVLCETMPRGTRTRRNRSEAGGSAWGTFVRNTGKLGRLVASDTGVWLEHDPDTVREPDIAFFSAAKMPLDVRVTGYSEVVPDLVVEVHSPSDSMREVHDKARMWLSYGVRLVWVVHPETRTIDVHRPEHTVSTLTEDDSLEGADILPGFTCPITDLFTV